MLWCAWLREDIIDCVISSVSVVMIANEFDDSAVFVSKSNSFFSLVEDDMGVENVIYKFMMVERLEV